MIATALQFAAIACGFGVGYNLGHPRNTFLALVFFAGLLAFSAMWWEEKFNQ